MNMQALSCLHFRSFILYQLISTKLPLLLNYSNIQKKKKEISEETRG